MQGSAHSSRTARTERIPITYQELAKALQILPPHSIRVLLHQALQGFRHPMGNPDGQDAWSFHAAELNSVFARWGGSRDS
jgi:hypothetical protein